jgi:hypothetical protein
MTGKRKRNEIKKRMTDGEITAGAVIRESKYTAFRNYLNGGDIKADNLFEVESALDRLEAEKKETK